MTSSWILINSDKLWMVMINLRLHPRNGSYYYSNPNGSTYYNNGSGGSTYTSPSGNQSSSGYGSKK